MTVLSWLEIISRFGKANAYVQICTTCLSPSTLLMEFTPAEIYRSLLKYLTFWVWANHQFSLRDWQHFLSLSKFYLWLCTGNQNTKFLSNLSSVFDNRQWFLSVWRAMHYKFKKKDIQTSLQKSLLTVLHEGSFLGYPTILTFQELETYSQKEWIKW